MRFNRKISSALMGLVFIGSTHLALSLDEVVIIAPALPPLPPLEIPDTSIVDAAAAAEAALVADLAALTEQIDAALEEGEKTDEEKAQDPSYNVDTTIYKLLDALGFGGLKSKLKAYTSASPNSTQQGWIDGARNRGLEILDGNPSLNLQSLWIEINSITDDIRVSYDENNNGTWLFDAVEKDYELLGLTSVYAEARGFSEPAVILQVLKTETAKHTTGTELSGNLSASVAVSVPLKVLEGEAAISGGITDIDLVETTGEINSHLQTFIIFQDQPPMELSPQSFLQPLFKFVVAMMTGSSQAQAYSLVSSNELWVVTNAGLAHVSSLVETLEHLISTGSATDEQKELYQTYVEFGLADANDTGSTSCISWGDNKLNCFSRGANNSLHDIHYTGSDWTGWAYHGGVITSTPSCVAWGDNKVNCFARGSDNALYDIHYNGVSWNGWVSHGGELASAPECIAWGDSKINCFVRGSDNGLHDIHYNGVSWNGWVSHGGELASAPECIAWGGNKINCFARGSDNALHDIHYNGVSWNGWVSHGGVITSSPSCVTWNGNKISCFARGSDNALHDIHYNGASWNGWVSHGGVITSSPSCVAWNGNKINCFVRGSDNALHDIHYNGASWTGWAGHGGNLTSAPECIAWDENKINCFARGINNELHDIHYNGSSWNGWISHSGIIE